MTTVANILAEFTDAWVQSMAFYGVVPLAWAMHSDERSRGPSSSETPAATKMQQFMAPAVVFTLLGAVWTGGALWGRNQNAVELATLHALVDANSQALSNSTSTHIGRAEYEATNARILESLAEIKVSVDGLRNNASSGD